MRWRWDIIMDMRINWKIRFMLFNFNFVLIWRSVDIYMMCENTWCLLRVACTSFDGDGDGDGDGDVVVCASHRDRCNAAVAMATDARHQQRRKGQRPNAQDCTYWSTPTDRPTDRTNPRAIIHLDVIMSLLYWRHVEQSHHVI